MSQSKENNTTKFKKENPLSLKNDNKFIMTTSKYTLRLSILYL